jgi:hypothetical protein
MHLMRRVAPNLATEPAAATGDSNRRARRVIVGVVALQASVALAIGVGIYVESRPPQVMVTSEGVSRGGLR